MHKPGESVVSIQAGSASDWLHVLPVFGSIACACLVIGALVGVLLCRLPRTQIPLAVTVSLLSYTLLEWRFAAPNEWSWQHPFASAAYQIGPVLSFFIAPTVAGLLLVRHLFSRHAKSI